MSAKKSLAVALLLVFFATSAAATAQDRIPWITDLEVARQTAVRQNRLVLLHFWSDDCKFCRTLERGAFSQPEFIRALTTGYIPVKIDANANPGLVEFYGITELPTDVIVTPDGRRIQSFVSKQDPNQYIAVLDGIRAKAGVGIYADARPVSQSLQGDSQLPPRGATSNGFVQDNQASSQLNRTQPGQAANVGQRYTNPYGGEAVANTNAQDSRWANDQRQSAPMDNHYATADSQAQNVNPLDSRYEFNRSTQPAQTQPQENRFTHYPPNNTNPNESYQFAANQNQSPQTGIPSHRPAPSRTAGGQPTHILEGYCAVTLIQNKQWQKGDPRWGARHNGLIYLFAGPQQQQMFLANPDLFAPLLQGYDPVRYLETGQLVLGKREFGLYVVEPGPIALFADEASLQRFEQNANHYTGLLRQAQLQQEQQQRQLR